MRKIGYTTTFTLNNAKKKHTGRKHWNAWTGSSYNKGKTGIKFSKKRGRKKSLFKAMKKQGTHKAKKAVNQVHELNLETLKGLIALAFIILGILGFMYGVKIYNLLIM